MMDMSLELKKENLFLQESKIENSFSKKSIFVSDRKSRRNFKIKKLS
jgi:hypothetical protein